MLNFVTMPYRQLCVLSLLLFTQVSFAQCPNLIWADEFDGNSLDFNNWSYQIGDGCDIGLCGWGNNELQSYQQDNVEVANGELTITARVERSGNSNYTSGRIRSINKLDFTYGRIEARIKLPSGRGLWPAFWMLSTNEPYGGWPQSGEIDIMEWVGNQQGRVFGTLHYGQPFPDNSSTGGSITSLDGDFGDEYHVYAVEWEQNEIRWYIDDFLFSTKRRSDVLPQRWPFDHDFHLLLNVAVGGTFGGSVDSRAFPTEMKVDYVRLYDGNRPSIQGDRFLSTNPRIGQYTIANLEAPATVTWSAPTGVRILSGQGTPTVQVEWDDQAGFLTADVNTPCGDQTFGLEIAAGLARSSSLENFDEVGEATAGFTSGTLTEVQNPTPNSINSSARVGKYDRNSFEQFDVLIYEMPGVLGDAGPYEDGTKQFFMDVLTDAPVGTTVLVQLETSAARFADYPIGRHSRYQATTTKQGEWERLALKYIDSPDGGANPRSIIQAPILFAPGVTSGATFFFDNFDIYEASTTLSTSSVRNENFDLQVVQNPVRDVINANISIEESAPLQLVLTNVQGHLVRTTDLGTIQPGQHTAAMQVNLLPPGTYNLSLATQGQILRSVSVVKQ